MQLDTNRIPLQCLPGVPAKVIPGETILLKIKATKNETIVSDNYPTYGNVNGMNMALLAKQTTQHCYQSLKTACPETSIS